MRNELGKPVIGLSVGLLDFGNYAAVGHQRPVALAGGIPFVLPWLGGDGLREALDACDGILLGGGRDIEPARYGQEPHELLTVTDPQRDAFELARSEERRVGKECTATCRSRWSPYH